MCLCAHTETRGTKWRGRRRQRGRRGTDQASRRSRRCCVPPPTWRIVTECTGQKDDGDDDNNNNSYSDRIINNTNDDNVTICAAAAAWRASSLGSRLAAARQQHISRAGLATQWKKEKSSSAHNSLPDGHLSIQLPATHLIKLLMVIGRKTRNLFVILGRVLGSGYHSAWRGRNETGHIKVLIELQVCRRNWQGGSSWWAAACLFFTARSCPQQCHLANHLPAVVCVMCYFLYLQVASQPENTPIAHCGERNTCRLLLRKVTLTLNRNKGGIRQVYNWSGNVTQATATQSDR